MQYLKTSLTGQAKAASDVMGFSSQAYYQAWDILCHMFGRPRLIVNAQMQTIYSHSPVRHDDSSSIVRFASTVTKTVNVMKQLGYKADLEAETSLGSATRKLSHQLEDQWLKHLQDLNEY